MRHVIIAVFLGCMLQGPAALAQPTGVDEPGLSPAPPAAMPAPPVAAPLRGGAGHRMDHHRLHAYLMEHSSRYRSNRRMMLSGILVASIGGGLGAMFTVIGLSGTMAYGLSYGSSGDDGGFRYVLTAGLTTLVVSLAVGLPLTFVGRSRASTIRKRHRMRISAGVVPGGGMVGVTWRF